MKFRIFLLVIFIMLIQVTGKGQNKDEISGNKKIIIQDLCWSPNNNYIYFSAIKVKPDFSDYSPNLWTIYKYDLKNKTTSIISKSSVYVSVSLKNGHLAFTKKENGKSSIYISDKDGMNQVSIISDSLKNTTPTWSPDGKFIAYVISKKDYNNIYSVDVKSKKINSLTNYKEHKPYNPVWSPDGKHITYYLEKGDGKDQIHVMNADGTNDKNITNDLFNNIFPGWIDSKTIIYGQAKKDNPTKTFQINIDGTNKIQVLQLESFYARQSPDKTKYALANNDKGIIEVIAKAGEKLFQIEVPK